MGSSYRVLGLDLGIGSLGFALIDFGQKEIVKVGVRLFDVPQLPKNKKSLAKERREARSARRNTHRRAERLKHCLKLLKQQGLLSLDATKKDLQSIKGDKPVTKLRVAGLNRVLSDREFAQVLYSLCSHRGYIPHGESDDVTNKSKDLLEEKQGKESAEDETKKVLAAISGNQRLLTEGKYVTVGELIARRKDRRSRNRTGSYELSVAHSNIVDEVSKIFERQRELGNSCASQDFLNRYIEVLSWQKVDPDYDDKIYSLVGSCSYFSEEKRAPKASLSFELCQAYERIGHCIVVHSNGNEEHLNPEVRKKIIDSVFYSVKPEKITYKKIRKWADIDPDSRFKGIDNEDESKEIFSAKIWKQWCKVIPELSSRLINDRRLADQIGMALTIASSLESLRSRLNKLSLDDSEKEMACGLPYNSTAYKGYGSRSLKALTMLIDAFEEYGSICTLSEAETECGLKQYRLSPDRFSREQLLPVFSDYDPTVTNPVVLRAMAELRKVVNAIIRKYGTPDEIHIELANELKHSKKEKDLIAKRNKLTENMRLSGVKLITEKVGLPEEESWTTAQYSFVSKILKRYELWSEQGERCIYCGKVISFDLLVDDVDNTQIDHIIPISRSADDSRMNKVLCCTKCNQEKLNRFPFEWFEETQKDWEEFFIRVTRASKIPAAKKEKLLVQKFGEEEQLAFIQRNLNDTRYASRATKEYLERCLHFPESSPRMPVKAVAGKATALLRKTWRITKDRTENNLHHAMDAGVIAATTQSHVMKVARFLAKKHFMAKEEKRQALKLVEPWPGFSDALKREVEKVYPTRLAQHKVSGAAFEETTYKFIKYTEGQKSAVIYSSGTDKEYSKRNFVLDNTGGVRLFGGLAYINLWWQPKKIADLSKLDSVGKYLIEPVYYADIPFIGRPDYVHRYVPSSNNARIRTKWDPIPDELLEQRPLTIFSGDAIQINGAFRRFVTINTATASWKLRSLFDDMPDEEATKGYSLGKVKTRKALRVIQEDVLGDCYQMLLEEQS